MGCITSTAAKSPPELCVPEPIQINIIAASKTPSFASSISGDRQVLQTTSNCASPSVVDGLSSVAMARSVSCTAELAENEDEETETSKTPSTKQAV
ncbi:hypothetical protein X975_00682, partial [Stegodyphus mimosarum]